VGVCRDGLEELYQAGARRVVVWDLCAGEAVPLANTLNSLMNTVNAILQGLRALDAHQNALRDFTKTFVVGGLEEPLLPCRAEGHALGVALHKGC
jgi:hypothetical protein